VPAAPHAAPPLARAALPLAAFWFLLLGSFGLMLPYYGLYLRENAGLSGSEVGAVFAVVPLVGILSQPLWGGVADRTGMRARVLVLLCVGSGAGFFALALAHGFAALLLATALLALFSRAVIPITLSVSLPALEDHPHAFPLVRAVGTLGFLAAVLLFPPLLARWQAMRGLLPQPGGPSQPGLALFLPLAAGLSLAAAAVVLAVPNRGAVAVRALRGEWRSLRRNRPFARVLAVGCAAFLFQSGPLELFPIFVRARGGDLDTVRRLWVVMLVPEMVLIAFLGAAVARLGPRALLALGIAAGGVRWLLSGLLASLAWLAPVQALHAVVVAGLMLGGPLYIDAVVPAQLRSTAQALFGVVAVGLGGACSSLISGWLLQHAGPDAPYLAGGIGSLGLLLALPRALARVPLR
jgi:PPP family 3-phenylpropionic acid transporter